MFPIEIIASLLPSPTTAVPAKSASSAKLQIEKQYSARPRRLPVSKLDKEDQAALHPTSRPRLGESLYTGFAVELSSW